MHNNKALEATLLTSYFSFFFQIPNMDPRDARVFTKKVHGTSDWEIN